MTPGGSRVAERRATVADLVTELVEVSGGPVSVARVVEAAARDQRLAGVRGGLVRVDVTELRAAGLLAGRRSGRVVVVYPAFCANAIGEG